MGPCPAQVFGRPSRTRPDASPSISPGKLLTRGLLRLQQAGPRVSGHQQYRQQSSAVHVQRGGRLQAAVWVPMPRPARTKDIEQTIACLIVRQQYGFKPRKNRCCPPPWMQAKADKPDMRNHRR